MEPVVILIGLAALALLALAPVAAIIVWVRLRELQKRVEQLEGRALPFAPVAPPPPVVIRPEPKPVPAAAPVFVPPPPPVTPPVTPPIPPEKWTPPAPQPARPRIEWERWLGVRGAAVLGGVFLAVAGVLFFQYSVQRNWITVERRVLIGIVVGLAAMVGGQIARKRDYDVVGNAITGAGAVILYAAFWGAHKFDVLPQLLCFAAMALVTASSCWLSFRTGSQLIAWLGLTGGFATPLLISTGSDRPIGLFAYILVLDLGFLFVAGRKRWPMLGLWGLVGTVLIQALWILKRMDPHELPIALVVLGVFALLFVVAGTLFSKSERGRWAISQVAAVLVPFLFAWYFAGNEDIGYNLWPLALLGVLLCAASIWLARVQGAALVPAGAAAGACAITLVWVLARTLDEPRTLELAICSLVLLAVFALGREWRARGLPEAAARGLEDAWLVACTGLALVAFVACTRSAFVSPWPFVGLFAALALSLVRVSASRRLSWVSFAAAPLALAGLAWCTWAHRELFPGLEPRTIEMTAAVLLAAVFAGLAWFGREGARTGFIGIALGSWVACLLSLGMTELSAQPDGYGSRLTLLFFAAIGCYGATAGGAWIVVLLTALVCAIGQGAVATFNTELRETWNAELVSALVSMAVLGAWLPLQKQRWGASPGVWIAAMAIPLFWIRDASDAIEHLQGSSGKFWIPVPFAIAEFAIAAWVGRDALWPLLAGIVCASAIVPLWVDRGVAVVWSALACLGAAWLARKRGFVPAVVVAASAAVVSAFSGVIVDGAGSFERLGLLVWNEHLWVYLVPALALLAAGTLLSNAPRIVCVVAGLLLALMWLTVEVHQYFAERARFELFWPKDEAREVAVSVSWALYALALLALGMRRQQSGLRWASLVLLVIVIGKLFLFDLSELQGLYRVASFLGLAVSLLLVSFGYQRFVFRKARAEAA